MPSDRSRLALFDIRDNVRLAWTFVEGLSEDDFEVDRCVFYVVTRCFEIISEAACRLPAEMRGRHPELPWRAIIRAGNKPPQIPSQTA
jgi:uncharacterized protein with HEPN domain